MSRASGFFVNRLARRTAVTLKMGFSYSAFQQVSRVGDDKEDGKGENS